MMPVHAQMPNPALAGAARPGSGASRPWAGSACATHVFGVTYHGIDAKTDLTRRLQGASP